ncbi:MAG: amino acid ABC transporter substrate-binding protein [Saprospiraceae bacterium]|jgi:hypothetical protein|nr:amino acid ABC transporter substrate-binding protein [Saprospiraceae bacterium]MBP9208929.1 amino acid ABC transporter substrate-binding protein [Saprospiraceae bacterium]MBV6472115.1 hypothetical protein [Saprospiraceae bacterium]
MTSVQNLLRPLNGNRPSAILLLLAVGIMAGCSVSRKNAGTVPPRSLPPVVIPSKEEAKKQSEILFDTIVWKDVTPAELPSKTAEDPVKTHDERKGGDDINSPASPFFGRAGKSIRMLLVAPFESEVMDSASLFAGERFVQFYSGMCIALKEYEQRAGLAANLQVVNETTPDAFALKLQSLSGNPPDCIIGPYGAEALKWAGEWARSNKRVLVSPWISSSKIAESNPYYLQVKAELAVHYQQIEQHVRTNFSAGQVFILAKSKDDSRLRYFNQRGPAAGEELIIPATEMASGTENLLDPYFHKSQPTVLIAPFSSFSDEDYIYHLLRRISSEKGDRKVIVYGTYRWLDFKPDVLDYLNQLNVRLSVGNLIDPHNDEVQNFRKKFFAQFNMYPWNDAYEGYDLANFLLSQYNSEKYDPTVQPFLQTKFKIERKPRVADPGMTEYYENTYCRIVEMSNYRFNMLD